MNRKQIFELEIEYIIIDLKNGIKDKKELITKSKKRSLIPINLRYLWDERCLLKAHKLLKA